MEEKQLYSVDDVFFKFDDFYEKKYTKDEVVIEILEVLYHFIKYRAK